MNPLEWDLAVAQAIGWSLLAVAGALFGGFLFMAAWMRDWRTFWTFLVCLLALAAVVVVALAFNI